MRSTIVLLVALTTGLGINLGRLFGQWADPSPTQTRRLAFTFIQDQSDHLLQANYCGAYSLFGALSILDLQPSIDDLVSPRVVSSRRGSTADDLVAAARSYGAEAKVIHGLNWRTLREMRTPVLLLLEQHFTGGAANHWVLYAGEVEPGAMIVDAPGLAEPISWPSLLTEWRGVAVVVGPPGRRPSIVWPTLFSYLPLAAILFGTLLALQAITRICLRTRFGTDWLALAKVVGIAVILATIHHFCAPMSLHNENAALTQIHSQYEDAEFASLEWAGVLNLVDSSACVLVDARLPDAYAMGHIPQAINIPIDSSSSTIRHLAVDLAQADAVIVYCESAACDWDTMLARRLHSYGLKNVYVYSSGYRAWRELHAEMSD